MPETLLMIGAGGHESGEVGVGHWKAAHPVVVLDLDVGQFAGHFIAHLEGPCRYQTQFPLLDVQDLRPRVAEPRDAAPGWSVRRRYGLR